ncbi:MAG: hypothetical protein ABI835_06835 [Chloroflexota bacterium]
MMVQRVANRIAILRGGGQCVTGELDTHDAAPISGKSPVLRAVNADSIEAFAAKLLLDRQAITMLDFHHPARLEERLSPTMTTLTLKLLSIQRMCIARDTEPECA